MRLIRESRARTICCTGTRIGDGKGRSKWWVTCFMKENVYRYTYCVVIPSDVLDIYIVC